MAEPGLHPKKGLSFHFPKLMPSETQCVFLQINFLYTHHRCSYSFPAVITDISLWVMLTDLVSEGPCPTTREKNTLIPPLGRHSPPPNKAGHP